MNNWLYRTALCVLMLICTHCGYVLEAESDYRPVLLSHEDIVGCWQNLEYKSGVTACYEYCFFDGTVRHYSKSIGENADANPIVYYHYLLNPFNNLGELVHNLSMREVQVLGTDTLYSSPILVEVSFSGQYLQLEDIRYDPFGYSGYGISDSATGMRGEGKTCR